MRSVRPNSRRRIFEVNTESRRIAYPFSELAVAPVDDDPVVSAVREPELGFHGFTYTLRSGRGDTVHIGQVLDWDRDPAYLAELLLYRLSVAARAAVDASPYSRRVVASRLGTSVSQLYRLIDPTNYTKSMSQVVALIHAAGQSVDFVVRDREEQRRLARG